MSKTGLNTAEIAELFGCKENTPRSNLCLHGHFLGVKPVKLPNGRLLWPADQVERVLNGLPARPSDEREHHGSQQKPPVDDWRAKLRQSKPSGSRGAVRPIPESTKSAGEVAK